MSDGLIRAKSILKKYPRIYLGAWFLKNINNEQLKKIIIDRNDNNVTYLRIENHGALNKDKIILLYDKNNMYIGGFFSMFNNVLRILYVAEKYHLTPVIKLSHEFIYAEPEGVKVNGKTNPWEYYFQQTSDISVEDANASCNVVHYDPMHEDILFHDLNDKSGIYETSELLLNTLGEIYKRYIKINTSIENLINQSILQLLDNKKTLGVHIRGTDWKIGFEGHPACVTPEEYLEHIEYAILKYDYQQIFLATDDIDALNILINNFGNRLVYFNDVERATGEIGAHTSNWLNRVGEYRLGFEVMRDVYALAACSGLIANLSHVSRTAQIIKIGSNKKYEHVYILSKKMHKNQNKRTLKEYYKNHRQQG